MFVQIHISTRLRNPSWSFGVDSHWERSPNSSAYSVSAPPIFCRFLRRSSHSRPLKLVLFLAGSWKLSSNIEGLPSQIRGTAVPLQKGNRASAKFFAEVSWSATTWPQLLLPASCDASRVDKLYQHVTHSSFSGSVFSSALCRLLVEVLKRLLSIAQSWAAVDCVHPLWNLYCCHSGGCQLIACRVLLALPIQTKVVCWLGWFSWYLLFRLPSSVFSCVK